MNRQRLIDESKIEAAFRLLEQLEKEESIEPYFAGCVNGYKQCLEDLGILQRETREIPQGLSFRELLGENNE